MSSPTDFLRLALDATRLAVLGHAAVAPLDLDEIAAGLGVPKRKVQLAVVKLQEAGLLNDDTTLNRAELQAIGAALPQMEPAAEQVTSGAWTADETDVLRRAFEGNQLKHLPAPRAKRLVVLERFAQEFEPGVRYSEREVNLSIQVMYSDYAAIRRYLVDEGFMTRADGVYWRSGGRYES